MTDTKTHVTLSLSEKSKPKGERLKQLIPVNTGGGVKKSPNPSANLSESGALTLNSRADEMIGADRWLVFYEEDPQKPPVIELRPAVSGDASAYKVTRASGSASKIMIKLLWQKIGHAGEYVGRFTVRKVAHGLRLEKQVQ